MRNSEMHHTIQIDGSGPADYRSVVAFFARQLLKDYDFVSVDEGGFEKHGPKDFAGLAASFREYKE